MIRTARDGLTSQADEKETGGEGGKKIIQMRREGEEKRRGQRERREREGRTREKEESCCEGICPTLV